jgi:hypothetical protein
VRRKRFVEIGLGVDLHRRGNFEIGRALEQANAQAARQTDGHYFYNCFHNEISLSLKKAKGPRGARKLLSENTLCWNRSVSVADAAAVGACILQGTMPGSHCNLHGTTGGTHIKTERGIYAASTCNLCVFQKMEYLTQRTQRPQREKKVQSPKSKSFPFGFSLCVLRALCVRLPARPIVSPVSAAFRGQENSNFCLKKDF